MRGRSAFTESQRRDLKRALGKFYDDTIDALESIVARIHQGEFEPLPRSHIPDGLKRVQKMNAEIEPFLRECRRLERVYRALSEQSRLFIDRWWTNQADPEDSAFGKRLAALHDNVDKYRLKDEPRRRGAPPNLRQIWIAQAVAWVLVRSGVPLRRSRDGVFARALQVVCEASTVRLPEDLFPLVSKVAPNVERSALLD